jgi:hypothetical protein
LSATLVLGDLTASCGPHGHQAQAKDSYKKKKKKKEKKKKNQLINLKIVGDDLAQYFPGFGGADRGRVELR